MLAMMLVSADKLAARIAKGNQPESVYRMFENAQAKIAEFQADLARQQTQP